MGVTPQALLDRPRLKPEEQYWMNAFFDVSSSRPTGESPGPIPMSEYYAYFQTYYIDSVEDREAHLRVLKRLDNVYLRGVQEELKRKSKT
jgi:hypothetical protein